MGLRWLTEVDQKAPINDLCRIVHRLSGGKRIPRKVRDLQMWHAPTGRHHRWYVSPDICLCIGSIQSLNYDVFCLVKHAHRRSLLNLHQNPFTTWVSVGRMRSQRVYPPQVLQHSSLPVRRMWRLHVSHVAAWYQLIFTQQSVHQRTVANAMSPAANASSPATNAISPAAVCTGTVIF